MRMKKYYAQFIMSSAISIVLAMIFINGMNYSLNDINAEPNTQHIWNAITIYVTGVMIYGITFLLSIPFFSWLLSSGKKKNAKGEAEKKGYLWEVVLCVFFLFLIAHLFLAQYEEAGFNTGNLVNIPKLVWGIVVIALHTIAFLLMVLDDDISLYGKYFSYFISIVVSFASIFILNPFVDGRLANGYDTCGFLEFNCIWETIYNVYDAVPYTYDTTGLYGHYGLFFLLPLKLFGQSNKIAVISFCFAFMACIQQVAFIYILERLSLKNWVASLLCLGSVIRLSYYAMQISPIRTLFPMLFFAYFIFLYNRQLPINYPKYSIGAGVLLALSFINNVEIGLACMMGLIAYYFIELIIEKASLLTWVKRGLQVLFISVGAIFFAIFIVNIYNLICGGPIIFKAFFFPLIGGDTRLVSYVENMFTGMLPLGNHVWEYVLMFLLSTFSLAFFFGIKYGANTNSKSTILPTMGAISIIGIVAFTYYMNEPLWTDLAVYKQIVYGLFAICISKSYWLLNRNKKEFFYQTISAICIGMISVSIYGAMQIINDPVRIAARVQTGAYDFRRLETDFSNIDIPHETYGIGQGVNIAFHELGLDNHLKMRDTSALEVPLYETYQKAVEEMSKNKTIFTCTNHGMDVEILEKLEENGWQLDLLREYQIGDWKYGYYSIEMP